MKEERIAKLMELLKRDPNDSFTRYALGLEYASLGQTETAVVLVQEVLHRDPSYVPAYHQLGSLLGQLGRVRESVEVLKEGIRRATAMGDAHAASEMSELLASLKE